MDDKDIEQIVAAAIASLDYPYRVLRATETSQGWCIDIEDARKPDGGPLFEINLDGSLTSEQMLEDAVIQTRTYKKRDPRAQ